MTTNEMDREADRYRRSDWMIQSDDAEISELAHRLTAECVSDRDKAIRIFYWVRDSIGYCIQAERPATEVLRDRRGTCVTKALLHVALLRAAGIRARLGHVDYSRDSLRGLMPDSFVDQQPLIYRAHTFAEAWLGGTWVTCDASIDAGFAYDFGFQPTEFDGTTDTALAVAPEHVVRRYNSASADDLRAIYDLIPVELGISLSEFSRQYQLLDLHVGMERLKGRIAQMQTDLLALIMMNPDGREFGRRE